MSEDRIRVCVRVRPYQEKEPSSEFILSLDSTNIKIKDNQRQKQQDLNFAFDHIFPMAASQSQVFAKIGKPIVDSAFQGINGTIFAYGQTSSGKTFTCIGPDCDDITYKGLLPRCVSQLFAKISQSPNFIQYRIKVTMVEIYMQKIRDLLDPAKTDLKIRQNKSKGVYIQDVTEQYVSSVEQTLNIFKKGVSNRVVGATNMNEVSSRSHMAFFLTLHQSNIKDGSAKSAKITVIDLAGSEKVSKTHAEGKLLDEAKQINKSLSYLGNVINALTDPKIAHVPYRDSKLTRLLQESLGGNSKTFLIINISPSSYNASQSISSLRFGNRAKDIKNKPKINKQYTVAQLLVLLQKSEKRNKDLQVMLNELTTSKKVKKKKQVFIENLLDSDNPIMSELDEEIKPQQEQQIYSSVSKSNSILKKCYESQIGSEDEKDRAQLINPIKDSNNFQRNASKQEEMLRAQLNQKDEQLLILKEEIIKLNQQKTEITRELDINQQRLQCVLKDGKLNIMKLNAEKREGQQLLQKYIKENIQNQQKNQLIQQLRQKLKIYQQKFARLVIIHQQTSKKSNIFGLSKQLNQETLAIFAQIQQNKQSEENIDFSQKNKTPSAVQQLALKDQQIGAMKSQVKRLQHDLALFKNLQKVKEDLIKQKLTFIEERARVYRDLQNRIEKVLQLQEKLDEQRQHRKYLQGIIKMEPQQKNRKIMSLNAQIAHLSQEYYVLRGQQSSWTANNKKLELKFSQQTKKLMNIQSDNLQLRAEIENLRAKCQDYQKMTENQIAFDIQYDDHQDEKRGNIVKVVKSHFYAQ